MRRNEPSKTAAMAAAPSENELRSTNPRRRERSRSRDSPRNIPFPSRDFSPEDNSRKPDVHKEEDVNNSSEPVSGGAASSSSCNCASCGPWPQEQYRDLSIRYPGMTKKSFDRMLLALEEVAVDSSPVSENVFSSIYSGVTFSPCEPPEIVPASPSELQPAERTEDRANDDDSSGQGGAILSGIETDEADCRASVEARSGEEQLPHCIPGSPIDWHYS